jgi:hypothetical protein
MSFTARWPSGLLLYSLAHAHRAGHAYYVTVFSSARPAAPARHGHCFATFVKAWGDGGRVEAYALQAHTLSWLPRTLNVQPAAPLPEPGVNLDLRGTLEHVLARGQRVWQWGPFATDALLYERALEQSRRLAGGRVRFQALDDGRGGGRVCGAFHAVSDLVEESPRPRVGPTLWGEPAGRLLALHLRPWLLQPDEVHPWVAARLGLHDYPITSRDANERQPVYRRRVTPPPLPAVAPPILPLRKAV